MKVLIANGPNLDLLGTRQPEIYGSLSLAAVERHLKQQIEPLCGYFSLESLSLDFFQTNDESEMIGRLSGDHDGIVLNPAAWTHTSIAIADRLVGLARPFVEVHLSNLARREDYRRVSFTAPHAVAVLHGLGPAGYECGLFALCRHLSSIEK